ncbi:Prolipoprotein diacylglyceryl transferase [bioreactor metagenome]|uniref:Prolipoprotein diacylglyceryl transferase n=1 Tax=bioreactor metagenome TaxID=1076179 RepID=A0A645AUS3_9ZZZZ
MSDYTVVYFTGITKGFSVPSVFADFTIPFIGSHVTIKFYGLIIAFGFLLAVLFGGRMAYKWKMSIDKMLDVLIYGTLGGIIGARLYFVIFQWDYYSQNPSEIFKIWEGGLAIYGGLIGGMIAAFITCKFNKLNFYNLLDIASMSFLIGQGIGRWGNFTNQEAFGTNTKMPWGMTSEKVSNYIIENQSLFAEKGIKMDPSVPVHPTFLYESLWCIAGFFILYLICKKFRKFSGQIILCYGIWYGIGRTIIEGFRTDSLYFAHTTLRVSQILSLILVIACSAALIHLLKKYDRNPKPIEGVDYFPAEKGRAIEEAIFSKETIDSESSVSGTDTHVVKEHTVVFDEKLADKDKNITETPSVESTQEANTHGENH